MTTAEINKFFKNYAITMYERRVDDMNQTYWDKQVIGQQQQTITFKETVSIDMDKAQFEATEEQSKLEISSVKDATINKIRDKQVPMQFQIRKDPIKRTVYVRKSAMLNSIAEMFGLACLLYLIGFLLTFRWNYALYTSEMVNKLYRVKITSSGHLGQRKSELEENDQARLKAAPDDYLSKLWQKLDSLRLNRVARSIVSWNQIDRTDISNLLSSVLNRRRLNLTARQVLLSMLPCSQICRN